MATDGVEPGRQFSAGDGGAGTDAGVVAGIGSATGGGGVGSTIEITGAWTTGTLISGSGTNTDCDRSTFGETRGRGGGGGGGGGAIDGGISNATWIADVCGTTALRVGP